MEVPPTVPETGYRQTKETRCEANHTRKSGRDNRRPDVTRCATRCLHVGHSVMRHTGMEKRPAWKGLTK
jgi:hypothetical protein